jgi:hypothetical protein
MAQASLTSEKRDTERLIAAAVEFGQDETPVTAQEFYSAVHDYLYAAPQVPAQEQSREVTPRCADGAGPAAAAPISSDKVHRIRSHELYDEQGSRRAAIRYDDDRPATALEAQLESDLALALDHIAKDDAEIERLNAAIEQSASRESLTDDAACKHAADVLRKEIERLEYPRSMVPQDASKISRRQDAFREAIRYLDPPDSSNT